MLWDGSEIAAQVAVNPVTDDALCCRVTGHYSAPPTPPRARQLRTTLEKSVKERGLAGYICTDALDEEEKEHRR